MLNPRLSHYERVSMPARSFDKRYDRPYMVRSTEQVMRNGKVLARTKYVEVDPKEMTKGLKVNDFSIENLNAIGADLKFQQIPMAPLDAAMNVDAAVVYMNAVDEMNNEVKNEE